MTLYFTAILLGLVEGLTEFLPVSSTGHLIVVGHWLDFEGPLADTFEVAIQPGAILAVCWFYRIKIFELLRYWRRASERQFIGQLIIAVCPALVVGFLAHGFIKAHLFSPLVVAVMLVVGGIVMWIVEKTKPEPRVHSLEEITHRDALMIGLFQCLAVIPGTSRSGATIVGALLIGLNRRVAAEFSFFLAIPTMFAASAYDLWKSRHLIHIGDAAVLGVGFLVSFVSGLIAIRLFLTYVSRHDFLPFAYYRIVFGLLMLLGFAFGGVPAS